MELTNFGVVFVGVYSFLFGMLIRHLVNIYYDK
jgi:hypothetical protein